MFPVLSRRRSLRALFFGEGSRGGRGHFPGPKTSALRRRSLPAQRRRARDAQLFPFISPLYSRASRAARCASQRNPQPAAARAARCAVCCTSFFLSRVLSLFPPFSLRFARALEVWRVSPTRAAVAADGTYLFRFHWTMDASFSTPSLGKKKFKFIFVSRFVDFQASPFIA